LVAFIEMMRSGDLASAILATMLVALVGFVSASSSVLGWASCSVSTGLWRECSTLISPGLYSLPRVALVPLFILWFGLGLEMKVILPPLLVFFPIFMNTLAGIRDVDDDLIDVIRVHGRIAAGYNPQGSGAIGRSPGSSAGFADFHCPLRWIGAVLAENVLVEPRPRVCDLKHCEPVRYGRLVRCLGCHNRARPRLGLDRSPLSRGGCFSGGSISAN